MVLSEWFDFAVQQVWEPPPELNRELLRQLKDYLNEGKRLFSDEEEVSHIVMQFEFHLRPHPLEKPLGSAQLSMRSKMVIERKTSQNEAERSPGSDT